MPRLRELVRALGRTLPSLGDADQPARAEPPPGRPILLVHGFAASSRVLLPLERWLVRTLGRPVFRLRLGHSLPLHTGDVRASALGIQHDLERLARAGGFRELDVVGHSMGGLVAAYLLKAIDRGERVRNVVTLGSPHRGTPLALAGLPVLGVLTRAIWQMVPGSPFVRELAALPVPDGCALLSVAGDADAVVPARWARIDERPGQRNLVLPGLDHFDLIWRKPALRTVERELDPELLLARRLLLSPGTARAGAR